MTVRPQDYPPLMAWYGHVEHCGQCAKAVLDYDFSQRRMCEDGYELRAVAREKTRWTPRMY